MTIKEAIGELRAMCSVCTEFRKQWPLDSMYDAVEMAVSALHLQQKVKNQMEWISVKDRLPENGQYVLAFAGNTHIKLQCTVVRFIMGISNKERKELEQEFDFRAFEYRSEDESGNNKRPYCWKENSHMTWFGQDISHWMPLPEPPIERSK